MTPQERVHRSVIERDGKWIACEGNVELSKPFEDKAIAEWWLERHLDFTDPNREPF